MFIVRVVVSFQFLWQFLVHQIICIDNKYYFNVLFKLNIVFGGNKNLFLFDTFEGIPIRQGKDYEIENMNFLNKIYYFSVLFVFCRFWNNGKKKLLTLYRVLSLISFSLSWKDYINSNKKHKTRNQFSILSPCLDNA